MTNPETALNDLRRRVLTGDPVTEAEYKQIFQGLAQGRNAAERSQTKKKKEASVPRPPMSAEDLFNQDI